MREIKGRYLFFAMLIILSVVMAGCSTNVDSSVAQNLPSSDVKSGSNEKNTGSMMNETMMVKDNKTDAEMMQDSMMQAIEDGSYDEFMTYRHHDGPEEIEIKMTVKNDVIESLSIVGINPHPVSEKYIGKVNDELQTLSVGKSITEVVNLPDQISGSSLTVAAFKEKVTEMIDMY